MFMGCPSPHLMCPLSDAVVVSTPTFAIFYVPTADGSSSTGISYVRYLSSVGAQEPTVSHLEVTGAFFTIFLLFFALFRAIR